MVAPDVIPLPHIYGARIKGVEVFCPLDPPPPYEAVMSQMDEEQVLSVEFLFDTLTASTQISTLHTEQGGDGALQIFVSSLASRWGFK